MGRKYEWGINPFQDFLFSALLYDVDLSEKEFEVDLYVAFVTILDYIIGNKTDSQHLDFEIRKKDTYFKVVAKNSISALWLSGVFPRNPQKVLKTNEYILDDIRYKYNTRTKKLTYRLIKK